LSTPPCFIRLFLAKLSIVDLYIYFLCIASAHGLITTVGYQLHTSPPSPPVFALEGAVAYCGATIQWLRDNLKVNYQYYCILIFIISIIFFLLLLLLLLLLLQLLLLLFFINIIIVTIIVIIIIIINVVVINVIIMIISRCISSQPSSFEPNIKLLKESLFSL